MNYIISLFNKCIKIIRLNALKQFNKLLNHVLLAQIEALLIEGVENNKGERHYHLLYNASTTDL